MTGKELIIYILQNNLENEEIFKGGVLVGFMDEHEAAINYGVGVETVKLWYKRGLLNGTEIGNHIYFPKYADDPRKAVK